MWHAPPRGEAVHRSLAINVTWEGHRVNHRDRAVLGAALCTALIAGGCAGSLPATGPAIKPIAASTASSAAIADAVDRPATRKRCLSALEEATAAIEDNNVRDAGTRPIPGFPFLRIDRFNAYFARRFRSNPSGPAFATWVDRLRALHADAISVEIANLSPRAAYALARRIGVKPGPRALLVKRTNSCADQLKRDWLARRDMRVKLVKAARVQDNYSDIARTVGLFPLSSVPISEGWERWKRKHLPTFSKPLAALPTKGHLVTLVPSKSAIPLTPSQVRAIVARTRDKALGVPMPSKRQRAQLFATFAPVIEIDQVGQYDRVGQPTWERNPSIISVDARRPVIFTRLSHTVVSGRVLLQLNYALWFAERPRKSPVDLLGGRLDGVVWRVTIAPSGRPILFDSIHVCGCYHLLFPTRELSKVIRGTTTPRLKERPVVLNTLKHLKPGHRVRLRLASASHYVIHVSQIPARAQRKRSMPYTFAPALSLRSLPIANGRRRSLFRPDGLVSGTERLERFVLWPTGVKSPGAMRQWGTRAIAFVDRRHFDDAEIIHKIFGR